MERGLDLEEADTPGRWTDAWRSRASTAARGLGPSLTTAVGCAAPPCCRFRWEQEPGSTTSYALLWNTLLVWSRVHGLSLGITDWLLAPVLLLIQTSRSPHPLLLLTWECGSGNFGPRLPSPLLVQSFFLQPKNALPILPAGSMLDIAG